MAIVAAKPSSSSEKWHAIYETLDLGKLNPVRPYFQSLGQALRFTGEALGDEFVIHPKPHELARRILKSECLEPLENVIQEWATRFTLPGLRPYAHGVSSVALEAGLKWIVKLSSAEKSPAPALDIVLQAEEKVTVGAFRVSLEMKLHQRTPSAAELSALEAAAKAAGYYLIDPFRGNFGADDSGRLLILDSDALAKLP